MRKSERSLLDQLQSEQKLGFYTEFFVEAGYLDRPEAVFRAGNESNFFDLASLTKALLTGPLVHRHLGNQLLVPLRDILSSTMKSSLSSDLMSLTPFDLLSHRSGLPAWRNFWLGHLFEGELPCAQRLNLTALKTFERIHPSERKEDVYSDLGYVLLGLALEDLTGFRLDKLWASFLGTRKMSARDFGFAEQLGRSKKDFVPSAFCAVRNRLLQGEVHDENCAALGGIAGHAGLFGQGPSIGNYLKNLYHSNEGLEYFENNHKELARHSYEGLLGLRRGNGQSAELFAQGQGMGHLGFVGTAFWMDLPSKRYVVFLTNRVISGRINPHITQLRRDVFGKLNELF